MRTDDRSDVGRMAQKEKEREDVLINDTRWVMGDIRGRRFLWGLMSACNVFRSTYCQSGSEMYFREGQRSIGVRLLAQLEDSDFEKATLMRKEAKNDEYAPES